MLRATVKLTNSPLENFYTSFKDSISPGHQQNII